MSEIRPAATVILLRDAADGLHTLLLRRNSALGFAGGMWVYPGGRIDAAEIGAAGGSMPEAARLAAVRETREEAQLHIDAGALFYHSHWTTPDNSPKRFATWFFVARAPREHGVTVDGSEIHDHLWVRPADALAMHRRGEIEWLPPTFFSLVELSACATAEEAIFRTKNRVPPVFEPHVVEATEGRPREAIYFGDAAYRCADTRARGTRHRIVMNAGNWIYINDGVVSW